MLLRDKKSQSCIVLKQVYDLFYFRFLDFIKSINYDDEWWGWIFDANKKVNQTWTSSFTLKIKDDFDDDRECGCGDYEKEL